MGRVGVEGGWSCAVDPERYMVTSMDPVLRAQIADACREHDQLMAAASEPLPRPLVQKDGSVGVLYREHDETVAMVQPVTVAPAAMVGEEPDWSGWQKWLDGHLNILRDDLLDGVAEGMMTLILKERALFNRELGVLRNENTELRGMLRDTLAKFTDCSGQTIELKDAIAQLQRVDLERRTRDQVVIERSGRIAELQRQNSATAAELSRQQRDQQLAERDRRIDLIETKLGMLLKYLGADLPRGFGRSDD